MPIVVGFIVVLFILYYPGVLVLIPLAMLIINPAAFIALLATLVTQMLLLAYNFPVILSMAILPLSLWLLLKEEKRLDYFLGKKEDSSMFIFVFYVITYLYILSRDASL